MHIMSGTPTQGTMLVTASKAGKPLDAHRQRIILAGRAVTACPVTARTCSPGCKFPVSNIHVHQLTDTACLALLVDAQHPPHP